MQMKQSLPAMLLLATLPWTAPQAQTYRYTGNMPMAKAMLDMMVVLGYVQRVPDAYSGSMWNTPGFGGLPGMSGIPGLGGLSGLSGMPLAMWGMPGMTGIPGMGGLPGMTGIPGMGGLPGMTGIPGMGGLPGMTGFPGMGGLPGMTGFPGMSGFPGANLPLSGLGANPGNWLSGAGNPMGAWMAPNSPTQNWAGGSPGQSSQATSPWNWSATSPPGRVDDERIQMSVQDLQALLETARKSDAVAPARVLPRTEPAPIAPPVNAGQAVQSTVGTPPIQSLDGVWRGANDEVLQVDGNQFIWTDKSGQATEGVFMLQGDMLYAKTPYSEQPAIYRVTATSDGFVAVMQPGDYRYEFKRAR